jgi:predicted amidohydrolase
VKDEVRVACVQMDVAWFEPEANLAKVRRFFQQVADEGGTDLILFPELANSGYVKERDKDFAREYLKLAEPLDGSFVHGVAQCAAEHHIYAVAGMLLAHAAIPATAYNASFMVSPAGDVIGVHHKMHIPGEERHYFYAGNTVAVVPTDLGNIGLSVCADRRFPELARMLALKGAEIICSVANIPGAERTRLDPERMYVFPRCRAVENQLFYAESNRVGRQEQLEFSGRSCIAGPSGELLARSTGEEEEVIRATLRGEELYNVRGSVPNFRDRRPELYASLTALA